jgi:hypothetical protein
MSSARYGTIHTELQYSTRCNAMQQRDVYDGDPLFCIPSLYAILLLKIRI